MKLKLLKLKTGAAVVPADYLTLRIHTDANYAGVLMDEKGIIPEIVFTSEKDVADFTGDDEKEVVMICKAVYPEVFSVFEEQNRELQAGDNFNKTRWQQMNKIGIRPLPETNDIRDAYFHGAIIRETIDFDLLKEQYNCQFEEEENAYEDEL